jgi:hypothetical protein
MVKMHVYVDMLAMRCADNDDGPHPSSIHSAPEVERSQFGQRGQRGAQRGRRPLLHAGKAQVPGAGAGARDGRMGRWVERVRTVR